jgi:hypothetical protein
MLASFGNSGITARSTIRQREVLSRVDEVPLSAAALAGRKK